MDYTDNKFDKFLTRKTPIKGDEQLSDLSSLTTEVLESGSIGATIRNFRTGLDGSLPKKGEKAGAIYFASDTNKLYIWNSLKWVSSTLS